jgi:hypothetical protein
MKLSKITKIAGAGLIGLCAVSLAADKIALNPVASQVAGFAGAFLGSLMAKRRHSKIGSMIGTKEEVGASNRRKTKNP